MTRKRTARKTPIIEVIDQPKQVVQPQTEAIVKENKSTSFPFGANNMARTANPKSKTAKIKAEFEKNPQASTAELVKKFKVSAPLVNKVKSDLGLTKKRGSKKSKSKKAARPKATAKATSSNNGHSTGDFLKAALSMGLDKAIETLNKVKKAIE